MHTRREHSCRFVVINDQKILRLHQPGELSSSHVEHLDLRAGRRHDFGKFVLYLPDGFRAVFLRDEERLADVLIGEFGELLYKREEHPGDFLESVPGHGGNLAEGCRRFVLVRADLAGVGAYRLLVLALVADLPYQPVGDVLPPDGDSCARVPEASAEAALNRRSLGVVPPDERVRTEAVGAPLFGAAHNLAAEAGEVGRARQRRPVRPRDDRGDARRVRELVLQTLDVGEVEHVLEADFVRAVRYKIDVHGKDLRR